jgi:hypothetical protein
MPYMFTGFTRCLVNLEINYDKYKLIRTSKLLKKNNDDEERYDDRRKMNIIGDRTLYWFIELILPLIKREFVCIEISLL